MPFKFSKILFSKISSSLVIGISLLLINSFQLNANTICLSSKVVQTSLASGKYLSNVSLISVAYFIILFGIGYAINRNFNLRKNREEDVE